MYKPDHSKQYHPQLRILWSMLLDHNVRSTKKKVASWARFGAKITRPMRTCTLRIRFNIDPFRQGRHIQVHPHAPIKLSRSHAYNSHMGQQEMGKLVPWVAHLPCVRVFIYLFVYLQEEQTIGFTLLCMSPLLMSGQESHEAIFLMHVQRDEKKGYLQDHLLQCLLHSHTQYANFFLQDWNHSCYKPDSAPAICTPEVLSWSGNIWSAYLFLLNWCLQCHGYECWHLQSVQLLKWCCKGLIIRDGCSSRIVAS